MVLPPPTIAQSYNPLDPTLKDLLDLYKKEIMLDLSCHHIGTVQSFNAEKQTAKVTINYPKTYFQFNTVTGQYSPVNITYPLLLDAPVIVLGGASAALTFPITKGDECLVLFNDRDLDNWFNGGTNAAVSTPRLHGFSDAMVLVGVRSLAKVIDDYDTVRTVLRNEDAGVGVNGALDKVRVFNSLYTLNTLLQELITEIQNLTTATSLITVTAVTTGGGISGPPANAAVITAINATITATAAKIGVLLE